MAPKRPRRCLGTPTHRCTNLTTHAKGRCDQCRPTTTQRGYGPEHQALRNHWAPLIAAGGITCHRPGCGQPIQPNEPWDLGHHDTNRRTYHGPEHTDCNRGHRPRTQPPTPPPTTTDT